MIKKATANIHHFKNKIKAEGSIGSAHRLKPLKFEQRNVYLGFFLLKLITELFTNCLLVVNEAWDKFNFKKHRVVT